MRSAHPLTHARFHAATALHTPARHTLWLCPLVALLLAACVPTAPPAGSCTLALATNTDDQGAVTAVLHAEGEFVASQQIDALMVLWADGATVVDAKNTPDDPEDDQRWRDKDAIRHRYVRTVFPGAPASATPADLAVTLEDERATVRATTQIGAEVSPGGDRWTLVKRGGCWLIENLTYNLEPNPSPVP